MNAEGIYFLQENAVTTRRPLLFHGPVQYLLFNSHTQITNEEKFQV